MVDDHLIFGFGSLVTQATHQHVIVGDARVSGYTRLWQPSAIWDISFLSVAPDEGSAIDGAILKVAANDWPGLLEREAGYDPVMLSPDRVVPSQNGVELFVGRDDAIQTGDQKPILLSYLDTVIAGFVDRFGADRALDFFTSTKGWEAGIKDDRAAPEYPRTIPLNDDIKALIDNQLSKLGL